MATSGALSTNNDNIKYKITITQNSQNVTNNTSNVTVSVKVYRTNSGYTTYGTGTIYCKINGTTYSASITSDDKITSSGIVLFSKTLSISHNSDGTKTLNTSSWIDHSQFDSSEQSFSLKLTTIPRATTPTVSDSDIDLGTSITISMPRASSSFTHTLRYAFGNTSGTVGSSLATSKSWTVPLSLASQIPKATSGKLTLYCDTYNGSTKIGTKSLTITVRVPSSVVPTISSVTLTDTNSTQFSALGGAIKGKSKLSVKITASGSYGSTISSYSTSGGGKTYSGASFTTATLSTAGTLTFTVTVKDSRGRTAKTTKSITVLDYANPMINALSVIRADSDSTPNDEGASLLINYGFTISAVNNKNTKSYTLELKAPDDTSYTTVASGSVYSLNTSVIVSDKISTEKSYIVRLTIKDYFKSVTHSVEAPTAFTLVDYHASGNGMAIGKVAEKEKILEIALPTIFYNGEVPNGAKELLSGTDIDELLDVGCYLVGSTAVSSSLVNKPPHVASTAETAYIEVLPGGSGIQRIQRYHVCSKITQLIFQRVYYTSSWGAWTILAGTTAWTDLTLDSAFTTYNGNSDNQPMYRVCGNMVSVKGSVSPKTAFTSSATKVTIASGIPEVYRPTTGVSIVCQGSGMNRWNFSVEPNGTITMSRYGVTENVNVPTSAWLIFNATYSI